MRDDADGSETVGTLRGPRPIVAADDTIEVIEWSSPDDSGRGAITIRWQPKDLEPSD
jgi:hypothetical protein